jgi:hypothetical protein
MLTIRYSTDAAINMVYDGDEPLRCPTQEDMDALPVGPDLTNDEIEMLDS